MRRNEPGLGRSGADDPVGIAIAPNLNNVRLCAARKMNPIGATVLCQLRIISDEELNSALSCDGPQFLFQARLAEVPIDDGGSAGHSLHQIEQIRRTIRIAHKDKRVKTRSAERQSCLDEGTLQPRFSFVWRAHEFDP